MKTSLSERGMTLVELLVVIVLIGLISVVVVRNVVQQGDVAKAELNTVRMNKLKNALGQYRLKYNSYPSKLDELVNGSADIKDSEMIFMPLADAEELKDIWGIPYIYRADNDGRTFALKSLGSDGIEGGTGPNQDITMHQ